MMPLCVEQGVHRYKKMSRSLAFHMFLVRMGSSRVLVNLLLLWIHLLERTRET